MCVTYFVLVHSPLIFSSLVSLFVFFFWKNKRRWGLHLNQKHLWFVKQGRKPSSAEELVGSHYAPQLEVKTCFDWEKKLQNWVDWMFSLGNYWRKISSGSCIRREMCTELKKDRKYKNGDKMQNNNTSPFEYITTRMNTLLHSDWTFFLLKGYSESAFFENRCRLVVNDESKRLN